MFHVLLPCSCKLQGFGGRIFSLMQWIVYDNGQFCGRGLHWTCLQVAY